MDNQHQVSVSLKLKQQEVGLGHSGLLLVQEPEDYLVLQLLLSRINHLVVEEHLANKQNHRQQVYLEELNHNSDSLQQEEDYLDNNSKLNLQEDYLGNLNNKSLLVVLLDKQRLQQD